MKDKSAIVKIDRSALIKKLIALSVDRELDFVDFKSERSRRNEEDVAEEMGSCHPFRIHPWEFLTSGQCYRTGLVLDTDDITRFARLEVRRGHVSQGVK